MEIAPDMLVVLAPFALMGMFWLMERRERSMNARASHSPRPLQV